MVAEINRINHKEERSFGFVMAGALLFFGLISYWKRHQVPSFMVGFGVLFLALALLYPRLLVYPRKYWIWFGDRLGVVNSYLLLTIIYFLLFVPIGFMLRLFKGDTLSPRSSLPNSYWIKSEEKKNNFKLQF